MQEFINYINNKYKIRWVLGDTICYSYKNPKGHFVGGRTMDLFAFNSENLKELL